MRRLADVFSGSAHVQTLGLATASDREVWEFAKSHDHTLVTKDADFSELSLLQGAPPKVIWLLLGNCKTAEVERVLRSHLADVQELVSNPVIRILRLR